MKYNIAKNILLFSFTFTLLIFSSEIILRYFIPPVPSGWGWNDSPRRSLANWKDDEPNQLGSRGQNIEYSDIDYVVLLVGDSQVEAATSPPNKMPEKLLQNYLSRKLDNPVKVFSIGASGWGQDQQLLALKEFYKVFRADLVLLWTTPKNDFWENAFPDRNISKIAGHLKPTYFLKSDTLVGPFFDPNTYYKNSVLLQILFSAIQSIKGETLEQYILKDWDLKLPSPHTISSSKVDFTQTIFSSIETDLNTFSENISNYVDKDSVTIILKEDFLNSRSHFSPFAENKSERDRYLIKITEKLFDKIINLATSNSSMMLAFYPIRKDYDSIFTSCVKTIKLKESNHTFYVYMDYLNIIKKVVPRNHLLTFNIDGGDELSVGIKDRHLSTMGNKKVMEKLAEVVLPNLIIN